MNDTIDAIKAGEGISLDPAEGENEPGLRREAWGDLPPINITFKANDGMLEFFRQLDIEDVSYLLRSPKASFKLKRGSEEREFAAVRHGHWTSYGYVDSIFGYGGECSLCHQQTEDNGYYCSYCGAKMDDELQRKEDPEIFGKGDVIDGCHHEHGKNDGRRPPKPSKGETAGGCRE